MVKQQAAVNSFKIVQATPDAYGPLVCVCVCVFTIKFVAGSMGEHPVSRPSGKACVCLFRQRIVCVKKR